MCVCLWCVSVPNALQALINSGVESVEPLPDEFERLQKETAIANRSMADRGMFSSELLEEMLSHVQEFRRAQASRDTMTCVPAGNEIDAGEQVAPATETEVREAGDMDVCEPDAGASEPLEQASASES